MNSKKSNVWSILGWVAICTVNILAVSCVGIALYKWNPDPHGHIDEPFFTNQYTTFSYKCGGGMIIYGGTTCVAKLPQDYLLVAYDHHDHPFIGKCPDKEDPWWCHGAFYRDENDDGSQVAEIGVDSERIVTKRTSGDYYIIELECSSFDCRNGPMTEAAMISELEKFGDIPVMVGVLP